MSSFFDFLAGMPRYEGREEASEIRLNIRRDFIVTPFEEELRDARVLDLASHDGRWSYALSAAGAREVVGIEGRGELIERFTQFPDTEARARVRFIEGDIFEQLEKLVDAGETFDVVAVYGIFYHVMDHYRLLRLIAGVKPKLVIIDSEFLIQGGSFIRVTVEDTRKILNAIPNDANQVMAPKGIPSRKAVDVMADTLGFTTEWVDWNKLPEDQRSKVRDYYRQKPSLNRRGTCVLRPRG